MQVNPQDPSEEHPDANSLLDQQPAVWERRAGDGDGAEAMS